MFAKGSSVNSFALGWVVFVTEFMKFFRFFAECY